MKYYDNELKGELLELYGSYYLEFHSLKEDCSDKLFSSSDAEIMRTLYEMMLVRLNHRLEEYSKEDILAYIPDVYKLCLSIIRECSNLSY